MQESESQTVVHGSHARSLKMLEHISVSWEYFGSVFVWKIEHGVTMSRPVILCVKGASKSFC